ncbi:MAG: hypothetical protein GXO25_01805 [Euryarchaeota archaeon]|nr:hypothetical protein [Euryarchaeota archaeon]
MHIKGLSHIGAIYISLLTVALVVSGTLWCTDMSRGLFYSLLVFWAMLIVAAVIFKKIRGLYFTPHGALPPHITTLNFQKKSAGFLIMFLVLAVYEYLTMIFVNEGTACTLILELVAISILVGALLIYMFDSLLVIEFLPGDKLKIYWKGKSYETTFERLKIKTLSGNDFSSPFISLSDNGWEVKITGFSNTKELTEFHGTLYYRMHPEEYFEKKLSNTLKT